MIYCVNEVFWSIILHFCDILSSYTYKIKVGTRENNQKMSNCLLLKKLFYDVVMCKSCVAVEGIL